MSLCTCLLDKERKKAALLIHRLSFSMFFNPKICALRSSFISKACLSRCILEQTRHRTRLVKARPRFLTSHNCNFQIQRLRRIRRLRFRTPSSLPQHSAVFPLNSTSTHLSEQGGGINVSTELSSSGLFEAKVTSSGARLVVHPFYSGRHCRLEGIVTCCVAGNSCNREQGSGVTASSDASVEWNKQLC